MISLPVIFGLGTLSRSMYFGGPPAAETGADPVNAGMAIAATIVATRNFFVRIA
jgi:hypothetical protein